MIEWFVNVTNGLAGWYRARSWRRVLMLTVLAPVWIPLLVLVWIVLPFWVLYMAFTWDGR